MALSVFVPVDTYIEIAKISQYLSANDIAYNQKVGGGSLNSEYSRLLYLVRGAVEYEFNRDPTDLSLNDTALYLYALCARYAASAQIIAGNNTCTPPFMLIQPIPQIVNAGATVFLFVRAGGTTPLSYQWRLWGVDIAGETGYSITINNIQDAQAGQYTCNVTNACGSVLSAGAVVFVNPVSLTAYWWYGDTDPYPALSGGTDSLTYQGSLLITHNAPISIPFPAGAATNQYEVVKVPIGESTKTTWYNTVLNQGAIPDSVFIAAFNIGSFTYYVSRVAMSIDTSVPVIFS